MWRTEQKNKQNPAESNKVHPRSSRLNVSAAIRRRPAGFMLSFKVKSFLIETFNTFACFTWVPAIPNRVHLDGELDF